MKINYILDTNVILHDPHCIFKFKEHNILIPMVVIEEIDKKKKEQNELGRNAREFSRKLEELRLEGNLVEGIEVNKEKGLLQIIPFSDEIVNYSKFLDINLNDNKIISTSLYIKEKTKNKTVIVSKDINLRIKSDILGLIAEDYLNDKIAERPYDGSKTIWVKQEIINRLYYENLDLEDIDFFSEEGIPKEEIEIFPNECFILKNFDNPQQSALARYVVDEFDKKYFKSISKNDLKFFSVFPKNIEQIFFLELLNDPKISLVTAKGIAGSGKTLLSVAYALHAVMEQKLFDKILLLKPIIAAGNSNELGFLPGNMREKLNPWMSSYIDNIDYLFSQYKSMEKPSHKGGKTSPLEELIELEILEMGSLEHIRGRSLPRMLIILDECQNVTPGLIKTILTRAGENTKFIVMGDTEQIDTPFLDSKSNGLTYLIEKFKLENISGHITLKKSVRSKLAEKASQLL